MARPWLPFPPAPDHQQLQRGTLPLQPQPQLQPHTLPINHVTITDRLTRVATHLGQPSGLSACTKIVKARSVG